MRVVSWKVWWRFGARWRERQDGILATLAGLRRDLVGLQESWAGGGTSQPVAMATVEDPAGALHIVVSCVEWMQPWDHAAVVVDLSP